MIEIDKRITSITKFSNIQSQYLSGVPIKRMEWNVSKYDSILFSSIMNRANTFCFILIEFLR